MRPSRSLGRSISHTRRAVSASTRSAASRPKRSPIADRWSRSITSAATAVWPVGQQRAEVVHEHVAVGEPGQPVAQRVRQLPAAGVEAACDAEQLVAAGHQGDGGLGHQRRAVGPQQAVLDAALGAFAERVLVLGRHQLGPVAAHHLRGLHAQQLARHVADVEAAAAGGMQRDQLGELRGEGQEARVERRRLGQSGGFHL